MYPELRPAEIQDTGEHAVIVPEDTRAKVLVVNRVGAAVLRHCDGTTSAEEIIGRVATAFGAPVERIRDDVEHFLRDAESHGTVVSRAHPGIP